MTEENLLIHQELRVINVGLDSFFETLSDLKVQVVHVDWHPPAGGDEKLMSILDKLDSL
ncbi:MAG: hypothetical protein PHS17_01005 [Desulfobacterales bacterium]|nr:hypothetical protein [Desulfobacterales bacterium]